jgi:hypothetical protein
VTVTFAGAPAVGCVGDTATRRPDAAAGGTTRPGRVPVTEGSLVSVTVNDWVPAVLKVMAKMWEPPSSQVKV